METITVQGSGIWYHGTPDARGLKKGFQFKFGNTDYISNPQRWNEIQSAMQTIRTQGRTDDKYFNLLKQAGELRKTMTYKKPIFFSNSCSVACTYADPKRAFDYQGAEPAIIRVKINDTGKILRVQAHGQRFRRINADYVKNALRDAKISEKEIDKYFNMFPHYINNNQISAETIGVIAQQLDFDIVDILGVLDSYDGGNIQATVRMVFNPQRIKVIN